MLSIAQSLPASRSAPKWLWQWLSDELATYTGRPLLVARMVIAATLVMLISMTFRIPFGWQGAIYALLVSRESPRATLKSAATIFVVTGMTTAYILFSMRLCLNSPPLHFIWIITTLFIAFYALSALTNYLAGVALVNTISAAIPMWDRHVSAETNVEDTLRLSLAVLIAVAVTAAVELAFARQQPGDEILSAILERLSAVEELFTSYAETCAVDSQTEQTVIRLEMLGTSLLRRMLHRSPYSPDYSAAIAGVAALAGRVVDLAATLAQLNFNCPPAHRRRFRNLVSALDSIHRDLINGRVPGPVQFDFEEEPVSAGPLLSEIEHTVALIPQAFTSPQAIQAYLPSTEHLPGTTLLAADAFVNPEHVRFALKGCLAASGSYLIYNVIGWPGISTAVTTCLLTALSTIGASHQKQMLRIIGAIVGGFLLGMGSQVFILPWLNTIVGFMVIFVFVTALSSWFMTSSPRLSYFGVQVALAFYLVNVEEFKFRTSLAVARDRVAGILLGLFMMWLVFDRLWGARAAERLRKTFILNLRLFAQYAREPASNDLKAALVRSLVLRETINTNLDKASALADGVLFEFGPSRRRDLELRDRIQRWQPQLRTLFVMRTASMKYRLELPGFELPESVLVQQQIYDEHSARVLEAVADLLERNTLPASDGAENSRALLNRMTEQLQDEPSSQLPRGRAKSLITLLRGIDGLTRCLVSQITTDVETPPGNANRGCVGNTDGSVRS